MASVWDQYAKPKQTSVWDQYKTQPTAEPEYYDLPTPTPPEPQRGAFGAVNDYVIEAANAVLGGGKALVDFAVPGTELANQIEGLIQQGVESQSQVAQQAKQQLSQDIEAGGMQALKGVGSYVLENPLLATSQAVGSFVLPGTAIKGAQAAARGLGVGERAVGRALQAGPITPEMAAVAGQQAVGRVGLGAGALTGAALGGGDAAGQAYQTVFDATGNESLATQAAREASIAPAAIGGLTGLIGAERIFAGLGRAGKGGRVRAATTTGLSEAAQETIEEGATQLSANLAAGQYVPGIDPMSGVVGSAALGFALGGITGAGIGGLTGGPSDPKDLINAGNELRQQRTLARLYREQQLRERPLEGLIQPGAGLSTQDLINQITGVRRPEDQERPTRESMEAALNEPTGQMVAGPGGIERPQTAGEMYGVPPAPARAAQPAAQQTQGAQPQQAQAPQIDPAIIQQTAQAYGVQQVTPGPGVPTQAFTIAGKTVFNVNNLNTVLSQIAQANQNKDPERVQLESAIVASGIPFSGQPTAKGILGGIDGVIKKYQLDGAATLNDAANILEFQISQGKSPKSVEPLARIYEALTGQMSPAFQRLSEGPTPAAGTAPLTPPESLGLMQPTGVPSGQPTPRAAAPAPATTAAPAATTAPAPAPVQAQPIRAAQPVSPAPSPRTEEVTAGAQAWEDMNVSTVQYSDLSEQDRSDWDQAVAEGRATGEAQEQLAKEYELIQEQGFMQQVLDRIIGRVIKSPNKARYYSTFLAAGAKQQDIIAKATENAERDADGNLTEKAQAQIKALSQELSALRGAPNQELAAEYGVALDTLKEWNQGLRTFLTDKATQLQEAARVVAVELRLEGGDLRNVLSQMVVRHQQAAADFQTATQLEQTVFDQTTLADPESGMAVLEGRTAASVQEVYNASETVNARFLRLQQELVDAENDGNQELADEITAKLDALTEDAAKQATKQARRRTSEPTQEGDDAVPKRETEKVSVQPRAKAGEKVGQKVRVAKEPAAKGETQKEKVVRTPAETAESVWTELRLSLPQEVQESIPQWRSLSDAQKTAATEFGEDLNMRNVEQIVAQAAPPQNAMRRRAEKHVQELTDTDQSLMLEDASLDEMTEAYEGVSWLRNRYESLGLGNVFSAVGQFFVSYNTNVDWDGIITNIDNQVSVVLRRDIAAQKGASLWTMGHELGHAVDRVIQGDDVYSSDQRLNLRKTKDRVIPMGEVAVEMANLRKKNDAINTVLGYPYDFNEVSDLTTQKVRQELFAQIWALYTTNDATRDIIDQQAPKTSAFMKEVLANVQTTENFNATNLTGPAFDSRKEGFPQRRDRPDESVGTAAQVAAAQQNLPVARSRNAQAAVNAIDGIPPTVKAASNVILQTLRNWTRKGVDRVVFTEALINRAVESGIRSAAEFKQLMQARGVETRKFEKEVERIADMYALVPSQDRGTGPQSVNAFIYDSTRTKKWGFQPKWRSTGVAVDEDLEIRFYALSSEAQSFIRAVFKHGDDTLAMKKKILLDYTNSEYDAQIKAAQADGNAELVAQLQKEKIADLKKFDTLFKLREGIPYAPLKRIGKYAVVAKSPEFRAAETANDKKRIRELEQDPNHYQVTFVDSDIQARNLQKQLQDQGFYGTNEDAVYYFEREKFQDELYGGDTMLAALSKLRATVERTGQDEKTTNQLRRIITDMYLHALADSSARKSELRRRAVPGEIDMLQSFALQGRADANFLAAVQYNNRTQEALQKMRKQAREGGNRTRKSELLNELNARYIQSLEYEPNQMVQKLNRLTSVYFLASSPGYYLQNFTQPWMMSLPVMAGRHDYTKSANALYNAYFDLKDVMKSAKLFDQQFDFSKVPDDIKDVVETLVNRSQIDIGISTEMGEFTIEGQGPVSNTYNKVDKGLRLAVQKVEAINRLTTAIAAYRLELAKTGNRDLAVDYASSIINDTHGDYSAFNAPRMFNTNIGKVALQFRKFQLIQLGLLAKLIKNSFEKGPEQQVARKALGYILAQTAVLTGVMGMPGAAAIAWALEGLLGDEDEPYDIKGQIRDAIGNNDIANIVLYGSPNLAGVNLSGKIGMGNALSVMPFTEIKDLNGEKTYQIIGTLLGGPAGGMAARMADGMSYIAAGDEYKGLELMLPKGVGDAMRSVRVYNEGFTSRRGDVLLKPDQIGEVTAFWQALGLTPTQTSVRGEQQGRTIDLEQKFSSRSSTLKRQYEEAAKDRNETKKTELRRQWLDLQAARVRNGYPRRPMTELTGAPQQQRKREQQVSEGVPFTESSRRFVERITE